MRKSTGSALLSVLALALVLRLSPLARFVYFGSDVGEYFRIAHDLVATGHVSLAYPGWGVTYPYFPGMFLVVAGPTFAGLELSGSLNLVVPALGALIPALVFLIAGRVLHEDKAALLAAAFVGVAMPTVFQTAHPLPATVGELLAVAALLLFLRLPRDPRTWALLVPLTVALVATHHLSAYFLVVMILAGLVVRALVRPLADLREIGAQALYVAFLIVLTLAYWFGYATTLRPALLPDTGLSSVWLPLTAILVLFSALAAAILLRRRSPWRYLPRYPSFRHVSATYAIALVSILVVMAWAVAFGVPGTDIRLPPAVLMYFLPFFAFLALTGAGRKHGDFGRHGLEASGWFLALVASMAFGALVAPQVIIPYRHVEFVLVVLAIFVGAGFARIVELGGLERRRVVSCGIVAVLVAGSALSAFPPPGLLVNFEEGVRPAALDASYWAGEHVDGLLATDHLGSTLTFGVGRVNATWDTAPLALTAPDFASARAEMCAVSAPSGVRRVDYVLIDADLASGVQLSPFDPAPPLSDAALAKFSDPPYQRVFDNGYAQVYLVNWGTAGASCP